MVIVPQALGVCKPGNIMAGSNPESSDFYKGIRLRRPC
jgi:hypothetical protein